MITLDGKDTLEISECLGLAKADVNKKAKLFMCRKLNFNIEKRLMKTYVLSVAFNEHETLMINRMERKVLRTLEAHAENWPDREDK